MSVGVDLLDSDHRVLMNIINSLAEIARGPRTPRNAERIGNTLDTLVTYTKSHFGREEKVMVASGFPGLDAHHGEHENFIRDVGEMSERIGRDEEGAVGELAAYLKSWWEHHILIQDMACREMPYLAKMCLMCVPHQTLPWVSSCPICGR